MFYDCHIHTGNALDSKDEFIKKLDEAGVSRAILFSYHPNSFTMFGHDRPDDRLAMLMDWASGSPDRIVPFYWIDPLDEDAAEQVDRAVEANIRGFKVICNRYYPGDDKPMKIWERIAKANKPMLFHSGILYANGPSSMYNRPAFFEYLVDIPNLKFALAHVSWPWCDENLAVYGKWQNANRNNLTTAEMFIDTTPGTPGIYRAEVLTKIYRIGYDIENNVMFGTDCLSEYSVSYANSIFDMDSKILDDLAVSEQHRQNYFCNNFLRFIGEA